MKIETLEYIHELLQMNKKTVKNALVMVRKNYHSAESRGEIQTAKELKEVYEVIRAQRDRANDALEDFERQEW